MASSGPRFLLAARACEIAELEQLARTCELVTAIGRFVHGLQRERGMGNIFLASGGTRFAAPRLHQVAANGALEDEVRAGFDALDTTSGQARNGARLFSRVALVLHALDGLPTLRAQVAAQALAPAEATAAYTRLVGGLLAVVFEAADSATDPQVTRALVALFNFMQGKELAGQERAHGAAMFASGRVAGAALQHWQHLVDGQRAAFQVFQQHAAPAAVAADAASQPPELLAELEGLRQEGVRLAGGAPAAPDRVDAWYQACTRRIDAMRPVEDLLAAHLQQLCGERIALAREELRDQETLLQSLAQQAAAGPEPAGYGPHMERSMAELVQAQALRLQAVAHELDAVRSALHERKVVERAKGVLMAHRRLSEDEAYKALRKLAMNQKRRLVEVAEAVLAAAEVLPGSDKP